jgi:myo-inositol-1(or 4)-monophosphatase
LTATESAARGHRPPAPNAEAATLLAGLERIFSNVRDYLAGEGRTQTHEVARNAKGEATLAMDQRAEEIAVHGLRELLGGFRLFAEERGVVVEGDGGRYSVVLDPCDGSANYVRGIRATGFSLAVLDGTEFDVSRVRYALIGDVFSGDVYLAAAGQGATKNGQSIQASRNADLAKACIGLSVGGPNLPRLATVLGLRPIRMVRSFGAAVLDLAYVVDGGFDACLFLWKNLTPENFAAAGLIIQEAGGCMTDHHGQPFRVCEMTKGYTLVASGNPDLHAKLVEVLKDTEPARAPGSKKAAGSRESARRGKQADAATAAQAALPMGEGGPVD